MSSGKKYYVNDKRYPARGRRRRSPAGPLIFIALVLVIATAVTALIKYGPGQAKPTDPSAPLAQTSSTSSSGGGTDQPQATATPSPSPTPTPTPLAWNPLLLPPENMAELDPPVAAPGLAPAERKINSTIFDNANQVLASFSRSFPISLLNPLDYNKIPGVLTFRGNNFRSGAAFGLTELTEKKLLKSWEKGIGSLPSSSWAFSWTGTGWTGQPLLVQWDEEVRAIMNIKEEKKAKQDLIEVIYATLDGNIYFLDIADGQPTRDPITIGAPIKGTPCIDSRGYPVLYVGQGDKNKNVKGIGFRVYNLIDQSLLLFRDCSQDPAYRTSWAACDSSPLFDAGSDTLIYPNENGLIYTARMNTNFDLATAQLSINPEFTTYRYDMPGLSLQGVESSMAVFDHYGYFSDNSGIFTCLDLNTMQPVWSRQLEDDSDVTPVLAYEGESLAVYTGTEVDWQKDIVGDYKGTAFVYKMDAMSGAILWESSVPCWTRKAANIGDDINGGVMGSPVIGKNELSDMVIFSFCMTQGIFSGNSVVAFDQKDGSILWEYKMNHYSWSSPVDIYDKDGKGYIVIADAVSQLHLIDGQNGERLDVLQLTYDRDGKAAGNIESSCAIFGNQLVVGTRGNIIVGVTLE